MRAGRLDRSITIESRQDGEPDEYGNVNPAWLPFATVRAQLVQLSTEEFLRAYGEVSEAAVIFRMRWLDEVTTLFRVIYEGRRFDIREIKEIDRRKGLELRCEEIR